jgi:nitroreductase
MATIFACADVLGTPFSRVGRVELADVARRRRMVRGFSDTPVSPDILQGVLAVTVRSPSAGNTAGVDAVVLEGPDQTAPFWEATTTPQWRDRSRRWPGLSRAPVVVAFFVHPSAYGARYAEPDKAGVMDPVEVDDWPVPYWFVDGAFAAMMMLLAAVDAGLGACFLGNFRGEHELRLALGVPGDRRYLGAVLLGEPEGADPPSSSLARGRRSATEVFHRGHW